MTITVNADAPRCVHGRAALNIEYRHIRTVCCAHTDMEAHRMLRLLDQTDD